MAYKDTFTNASPVYLIDDRLTVSIATAATLAAGATSSTVAVNRSGTYGFTVILTGTSPSLTLQQLGPDGTTWMDVVTVTASGSQPITIFAGAGGAAVRLKNAGANPITALTASFVS